VGRCSSGSRDLTLSKTRWFGEINWNHRSIVEVNGPVKKQGWFLHANTGDAWLLRLSFRVKRNTFKQDELREQLALESLDDLDELPIYGRSNRVRVKNLKGPWQEISLTIHWQKESILLHSEIFWKSPVNRISA